MLRTVPNRAGVGLVRRSVRYRAREWITHRRRTTRFRLFSTVRAALMSGNRVSDCSGVMSIPTNAATKPR